MPAEEQNSYLHAVLAVEHRNTTTPVVFRHAADEARKVGRPRLLPKPSKPGHQAALEEFRNRERAPAQKSDPANFSNFLADLERHVPGVEWEEFRVWPAEEQKSYLRCALAEGYLDRSVPATVRRAADEALAVEAEPRRPKPSKPNHNAALEEFRNRQREPGQRKDPVHFANFLRDLEHHAPEVEWDEFRHWPAEEQVSYLLAAIQEAHLNKNARPAVRRAARHEIETDGHGVAKQEPGADRARAAVWVEKELDQARTAFIPELPHCDLTSGQPIWSLDPSGATVVRHAMEPVEANNHKFPMRDSIDPLGRVYARYAGENGRCHENVRLRGIDLASGYKTYFTDLCKKKLGLPRDEANMVRDQLLRNAQQEFERLIREEPTASRPCVPRQLTPADLSPHESMLGGQYGLFLTPTARPQDQPTLRNGHILGFYMGVFAASDEEIDAIEAQHPDFERYAMDAVRRNGRLTLYSAQGCANDLAFANTALRADAQMPEYDWGRINAEFVPFEVKLTDKDGKPTRETVVAMVALDNAIGNEIRVDYGSGFLNQFMTHGDRAVSESSDAPVKMELDE